MKVWLSTIGQRLDHADNTRTMLLARYLIERGHEVTLWTSAYDHIRKQWRREYVETDADVWTMANGLHVRFLKGCGYRRNVGVRRLVDHILAARDFRRQARALPTPDAVVASLPDHITAAAMIDFARENAVVSFIDVRDKWPDIFIDYAPRPLKPFVRLGLVWESRRARRALARADVLVAMMGSMLAWGLVKARRQQRPTDQVFFLATMDQADEGSAPLADLTPQHRALMAQVAGKMVFTFVGTFNRTQHPSLILDACARLAGQPGFDAGKIAVLIGGDGVDAAAVDSKIAALPFVHRLGWLKPEEMRAILVRSDVGLLPMNFASPAFNNKAFAYLACGLPIINGALGDLAELIAAHGVGINVAAGSAPDFADAMAALLRDPAEVRAMQDRTRRLYAANFEQAKTYSDYVDHIVAAVDATNPRHCQTG
jgi:glycosyltransferase involved in cell wall biosynthesis